MPVDSAVLVFFPVMAIGDSRKKAHHLRNIGVKLEFCSLLSTRLGRCALVVSKMMLISAEKVAWVMSELKVDARRSDVGTRLLRRRGHQLLSFLQLTIIFNRQRLKQRITLIYENLKRRSPLHLSGKILEQCRLSLPLQKE